VRAAAVDVGTNSIKVCVGEKTSSGEIHILKESYANIRLGEGISSGNELQPESVNRAIGAIAEQVNLAREYDVDAIRMVGTSAVREASNSSLLIDRVLQETGIRLEPISEHDEARLSYYGVALDPVLGDYQGKQLVVDVGGGSTEFIYGQEKRMGFTVSVRVGIVRLTERFLKGDRQTLCQLVDAGAMADKLLQGVSRKARVDRIVGVGGSVINLARIREGIPIEETHRVHGMCLTYKDLRQTIDILITRTVEERRKIVGLESERADTIIAGAVILDRILALFEQEKLTVSVKGLRYGLLYEMLSANSY